MDAVKAADTEWDEAVVVFEAAEFAFDGGAAPVEVAPAFCFAGDERIQPRRLPPNTLGLAGPGGAAPLRSLVFEVRPGECPGAVLACWWEVFALLDGWGLAERDDRQSPCLMAGLVDRLYVVALVERDRFWREVAGLDGVEKPLDLA